MKHLTSAALLAAAVLVTPACSRTVYVEVPVPVEVKPKPTPRPTPRPRPRVDNPDDFNAVGKPTTYSGY
jgi:hypothetical protein